MLEDIKPLPQNLEFNGIRTITPQTTAPRTSAPPPDNSPDNCPHRTIPPRTTTPGQLYSRTTVFPPPPVHVWLVRVGVVRGGRGNCPRVDCLGAIVRKGNCPGSSCPGAVVLR